MPVGGKKARQGSRSGAWSSWVALRHSFALIRTHSHLMSLAAAIKLATNSAWLINALIPLVHVWFGQFSSNAALCNSHYSRLTLRNKNYMKLAESCSLITLWLITLINFIGTRTFPELLHKALQSLLCKGLRNSFSLTHRPMAVIDCVLTRQSERAIYVEQV